MSKYNHLVSSVVCFHQIIVLQSTIIARAVAPLYFTPLPLLDTDWDAQRVIPVNFYADNRGEDGTLLHGNLPRSGFEWRAAESKIPKYKGTAECGNDCKVDANWRTSEKILLEEDVCLHPELLNKGDVVDLSDDRSANQLYVLEEEKRSDMSAHLEALQRLATLQYTPLLPHTSSYSRPQGASTRAESTPVISHSHYPPIMLLKPDHRICAARDGRRTAKERNLRKRRSVERLEMPRRLRLPPALSLVHLVSSGLPSLSYKSNNDNGMYTAFYRLARGAFGEVWRAIALDDNAEQVEVVLKRMIVLRFANSSAAAESPNERMEQEADDRWATGAAQRQARIQLLRAAMDEAHRSGRREEHFGNLFRDSKRVSRFIKSFWQKPSEAIPSGGGESDEGRRSKSERMCAKDGGESNELWLVFANEGFSLANVLFHPDVNAGGKVRQSVFWLSLKSTPKKLREVFYQLTEAVTEVHRKNVVHRDIKLENIFIQPKLPVSLRLGDWGSALQYADVNSSAKAQRGAAYVASLYGRRGPSLREETADYAPPEVALQADEARRAEVEWSEREVPPSVSATSTKATRDAAGSRPTLWPMGGANEAGGGGALPDYELSPATLWREPTYDMWSLGVTFMEIVLGRRDVLAFQQDTRTLTKLEKFLKSRFPLDKAKRQTAVAFYILGQLCLAPHDEEDLPTRVGLAHWADSLRAAKDFATSRLKKRQGTTATSAALRRDFYETKRDMNMTVAGESGVLVSTPTLSGTTLADSRRDGGALVASPSSMGAVIASPPVSALAVTVPLVKTLRTISSKANLNLQPNKVLKPMSFTSSSSLYRHRLAVLQKPYEVPTVAPLGGLLQAGVAQGAVGDGGPYNIWRSAAYVAKIRQVAISLSSSAATATQSGVAEKRRDGAVASRLSAGGGQTGVAEQKQCSGGGGGAVPLQRDDKQNTSEVCEICDSALHQFSTAQPTIASAHVRGSNLVEVCSDSQFAAVLQRMDVSGIGLTDDRARDFLRRLLTVNPDNRMTAEQALQHDLFTSFFK